MSDRRRRWLVSLLTVAIVTFAADGWGYWTASGVGSGAVSSASLAAATLSTPGAATNSITVSWAQQATLTPSPSLNAAITYSVERRLGGGAYAAVPSGGCSGTKTYAITSCSDSPATSGSYSYRAVAAYATWTATSATSGPVVLLVDTAAPTVSSIARLDASPSNAASVTWTVSFSEAVTGVGTADFALARTGGLSGGAVTSVTGSGTTYTVAASTGSGDGTLGLNLTDDDTITDVAANPLGGMGAGNGSFTGETYAIDKAGPAAVSIVPVTASPTNAASLSWTVTFNESTTGVGTTDFALAATGPSGAAITAISGSGTVYTVTASTGTGSGTLGLNLTDDDTIIDALANPLGGSGAGNGAFTGQTYTIDKTGPTASSINRATASPTNLASLSWTVTFTEPVSGVGAADFTLVRTGVTGGAISGVTGSGTTYTVTSTSGSGDGTFGLNLEDDDSIADALANPLGGTGTGNGTFAGQIYSIDKTAPALPTLVAVTSGGPVLGATTCGVPISTQYVNSAGAASVGVRATITGPLVTDQTISFSAVSGGVTVSSAAVTAVVGANVATLDLSSGTFLAGSVTLTAKTQDALGNESASVPLTNIVKDVTVAALSGLSYSDVLNALGARDRILGTSECGAQIAAVQTVGGSSTYTLTIASGSTFALNVTSQVLSAYSYNVTATDLAGNTSAISVVSGFAVL